MNSNETIVIRDTPAKEEKIGGQPLSVIAVAGNILQTVCFTAANAAGWWNNPVTGQDLRDDSPNHVTNMYAAKIALMHSELSEALEGLRKNLKDDKLPHRSMVEVELADAVIRICDTAGAMGLNLGDAIAEKLAFNAVRPDHKLGARNAEGGKAI